MAVPRPLVEIGFDLTGKATGPYLTLDDPVKGKLDDSNWVLGGTIFFDVTSKVKSISITRGKNRQLGYYDTGLLNVVFNNQDRTFDPEFVSSPYYGQIIPKRTIRVSLGGEYAFYGVIDDWNLNYDPDGDNTASAAASDAFTFFATQTLPAITPDEQKTGERIDTILSLSDVDWPVAQRDIETGIQTLGTDAIDADTNVLDYLRVVSASEPGSFFVGKNGHVYFRDRRTPAISGGAVLSDDGTGIPYTGMKVVYGSELLFNEVVIGSVSAGTATTLDETSINEYGHLNLTQTGLLMNSTEAVADLSAFYTNKFSQPEYRFESLTLLVDQLTLEQQATVLAFEIGDVVKILFTPAGVTPAIEKYAEIIAINNSVDPTQHAMTLGFATLDYSLLVLDDTQFGKLSSGNALAF